MTLLRPRDGRNRKVKVGKETKSVKKMRITSNTSRSNRMNFMIRTKLCDRA